MIVQVGPYPEPIGGISIYIKRMKRFLDDNGIKNEVWDISGISKNVNGVKNKRLRHIPLSHFFNKEIELIHYNICGNQPKKFIGLFNEFLLKNRKKILTIHGDCRGLFNEDDKYIIKALNTFNVIICVKSGDKEYLDNEGINTKIYEIPAFVLPQPIIDDKIPIEVNNFISQHKFIITANASSIRFYNGYDLYGIDMCIELMIDLKKKFNNREIGFIFCLPDINDTKYFEKMEKMIRQNDIKEDFLFVNKKTELYPIIKKSHLFIRPTITDGDALSIRESIKYNVPVITSDVVKRPEGTILFKTRDLEDLFNKTNEVICNYNMHKRKIKNIEIKDNAVKILEIYKEVINENY